MNNRIENCGQLNSWRGRVSSHPLVGREASSRRCPLNSTASHRPPPLVEGLSLFRGLTRAQLHAAAAAAWDDDREEREPRDDPTSPTTGLRDTLRPEMVDLIARLRGAGWRVLIVTASPVEAVLRGAEVVPTREMRDGDHHHEIDRARPTPAAHTLTQPTPTRAPSRRSACRRATSWASRSRRARTAR